MPPPIITLNDKLAHIHEHWDPKRVASLNGQDVRLARFLGEFVWHAHDAEDEMFLVLSGELDIEFRDGTRTLHAGDCLVVPRGVEHRPVAREEVAVLLFEPSSTVNTGDTESPLRREQIDPV